jgi:osmotically-inducible protein OsmY
MQAKFSRTLGALLLAGSLFFLASCKPSDSQISKSVNAAVSGIASGVTATVDKGQVTLDGTVADQATKTALEAAVKKVKGVVTVTDNTTTAAEAAPAPAPVVVNPDDIVRNTIDSVLQAKQISGVTVTVSQGTVTLSGNAARKDLKTIMQVANESHPAKVVNQLTIH